MPGTSISEKARERFSLLAENLLRDRGVGMELTAVVGRRWSAVAGPQGDLPLASAERLPLADGWGLVLYGVSRLKKTEREALLKKVEGILSVGPA